MEWAVANRVVNGMTATTLAPKGQATRPRRRRFCTGPLQTCEFLKWQKQKL